MTAFTTGAFEEDQGPSGSSGSGGTGTAGGNFAARRGQNATFQTFPADSPPRVVRQLQLVSDPILSSQ